MYSFMVTFLGMSSNSLISVIASCKRARSELEILSKSQFSARSKIVLFSSSFNSTVFKKRTFAKFSSILFLNIDVLVNL